MSLYCDDGLQAIMPPPGPPPPKPERGAPWKPPAVTVCGRCGRAGWQHRSFPPVLADEIDRAIYAAAFVAAMQADRSAPDVAARGAIRWAERLVEIHRRARSGT